MCKEFTSAMNATSKFMTDWSCDAVYFGHHTSFAKPESVIVRMASPKNPQEDKFDLRTIYNELSEVKYKWFKIGLQMRIPHHKLKEFELEEQDPLAAIINYGLKGNLEDFFSWKSIVEALKQSKTHALAKRIELKYCQEKDAGEINTGNSYQESIAASSSSGSSSFKLPTVSMACYFPHLQGRDKMSDDELSSFCAKLDEQTSKIKQTFASLVFDLQRNIEKNYEVDDLVNILKFLDDRKFVQVLLECSTTAQVFEKLSPFFSFFDYEVIKFLTKKLGSELNKEKLEKYRGMFEKFAKQRVCECPSDAFDEVGVSEKVFVLKTDRHIKDLTVQEVKTLKHKLCGVLKLHLKLLRIDEGCVKLALRACNIEEIDIEEQKQLCSQLGTLSCETLEDLDNVPFEKLHKSAQPTNIATSADLHEYIKSGNVDLLKLAIENGKYNPLDKDIFNFNALHTATKYGRLEMLRYLVEDLMCNPTLPGDQGETPLHIAAKFGQLKIIEYLISEQGVDPDTKDNAGYLPAHHACLSNELEALKWLVTATCEYMEIKDLLTSLTKDGLALIHLASLGGHFKVLEYLVKECNCDPSLLTKHGCTPIHMASEKGHLKIIKYLVTSHECDHSAPDHDSTTPLHVAARNGHLAVVQYLIKQGCNANATNKQGKTPLFEAAHNGWQNVVQYLIEKMNCDPNVEEQNGFNCLHAACDGGHIVIVQYLLKNQNMDPFKRVGKSKTSCLHLAARKGRQLVVEHLSDMKNMKHFMLFGDDDEFTPLHLAAQNNHVMALKCFIKNHHTPPNLVRTSKGVTPLMLAQKNPIQNHDAIAFLETQCRDIKLDDYSHLHHYIALGFPLEQIKKEASKYKICDIPNTNGQTPLHFAAHRGRLDVVKYLVEEKSCNPHNKDGAGFTSLHMAAEGGSLEVVEYLMTQHLCDPTAVSNGGSNFDSTVFFETHQKTTPLHAAAEHGHIQIVKFILQQTEYPVDPEVRSHLGLTPLLFAAKEGELNIVKYLITRHRCNPLHQDVNLNTAIHHATKFGHLKVLKYLVRDLKLRADLENAEQMQPIHIAAIQGDLKMLKFYLGDLKINSNTPNGFGLNILHLAAAHGHLEMIKYLANGSWCDPSSKDKNGRTPLHWAAIHGQVDVVKYFTKDKDVEIQCKDSLNRVPLHYAAAHGHFELTRFLVKDVHTPLAIKDYYYCTPLDYALMCEQDTVALYLIVACFKYCVYFDEEF